MDAEAGSAVVVAIMFRSVEGREEPRRRTGSTWLERTRASARTAQPPLGSAVLSAHGTGWHSARVVCNTLRSCFRLPAGDRGEGTDGVPPRDRSRSEAAQARIVNRAARWVDEGKRLDMQALA